jgi:hypothetical protein
MSNNNILEAVNSLKNKNTEGHDRIPQRILIDGIELLKYPLSFIFNQIYNQKKLPQQWLIAKITPIFKKGNSSQIENYRPISNLCTTSKIFEKLILQRIKKLEKFHNIDLTGKPQHGFKSNHSTMTAGLKIQSVIARALNDDEYALMASLDLSSAFDVVNVDLLIKRLNIMGLPSDIICLINEWLNTRYFYVSVDGENSIIHSIGVGTVQGSILGPILYALFVSPLFDLAKMTLFADDNYVLCRNTHLPALIHDLVTTMERIIKWLKNSGLKVNDAKTEVCLFSRTDVRPIKLTINGIELTTKKSMNVLGVHFDTKLNWQTHMQSTITKANKALQAIKLIKKNFTKKELMTLVIANYYSILFYNSEIWHIPSLCRQTKTQLMRASANPLKICCPSYDMSISFERLHNITHRPNPDTLMKYKHALLLHKVYNSTEQDRNWSDLFFNQQFNERQTTVNFFDMSRYKQGKNILSNRLNCINGTITYNSLNLEFKAFKSLCKKIYFQ